MTQTGRFQSKTLLSEQGEVKSYGGLDALTGLPVLIYRFSGRPMPGLGELESDAVPSALHTSFGSKGGELVVAFAPGYKPLQAPVAAEGVPALLFDSVRALRDAAEAGVLHGNLKPERFLQQGGHHLIEGYGVRWPPEASPYTAPDALQEASFAGDVFSWAKSVEALCGPNLPDELAPLFERALSLDPHERPSAKTLFEAVRAHYGSRESAAAPVTAPLITVPPVTTVPGAREGGPRPHALSPEDETGVFDPGELEDEPPPRGGARPTEDVTEDSSEWPWSEGARGAPPAPQLVRRPPSEAQPHAQLEGAQLEGAAAAARRRERAHRTPPTPEGVASTSRPERLRPLLLAVLALGVVVLLLLNALPPRAGQETAPPSYPVTIAVAPEGLRPVVVTVVSSPADSALQAGSTIRNVPGQVTLERGEWVLRANHAERWSPELRFTVPETRGVTVVIPED